jgi:hypothetical protein
MPLWRFTSLTIGTLTANRSGWTALCAWDSVESEAAGLTVTAIMNACSKKTWIQVSAQREKNHVGN